MKKPQRDASWSAEVVELWQNDMREMWDRDIERHSYNSYQNQLDVYFNLARELGARNALDVGCAQATLAMLLAERGLRVTAVDIRKPFLDYAQTRWERGDITFVDANLVDEPALGTFDLVFANQIIEHLVRPADFLRTLARYVEPRGAMVITTPNHAYFRSSLPSFCELGDPAQYEHLQYSATGADHFFAYTEDELREEAAAAGLVVERVFYYETPWISGHFLFRMLHRILPVGLLRAMDKLTLAIAPRKLAHQLGVVLRRNE